MRPHRGAGRRGLAYLQALCYAARLMDDAVDADHGPVDYHRLFHVLLVELPANPFFQRHRAALIAMHSASLNAGKMRMRGWPTRTSAASTPSSSAITSPSWACSWPTSWAATTIAAPSLSKSANCSLNPRHDPQPSTLNSSLIWECMDQTPPPLSPATPPPRPAPRCSRKWRWSAARAGSAGGPAH